jgi:hypothetical protein
VALEQNTTLHSSGLKTAAATWPEVLRALRPTVGMSWAQCPYWLTRSAAAAAASTAPFLESADEKSCNCREDRMPDGQPLALSAQLSPVISPGMQEPARHYSPPGSHAETCSSAC